jgi:hypothetical protein
MADDPAYLLGQRVGRFLRPLVAMYVIAVGAFLVRADAIGDGLRLGLVIGMVVLGLLTATAIIVTRYAFWGFLGLYLVTVMIGSRLASLDPRPDNALIAVAAGSVIAAVGFIAATMRRGRQSTELERMLFAESTSLAFFVTMSGAVTYGLLEAWVDAPKLSMWIVWSVGMGAWLVLSIVLNRRYS